MSHNPEYVFLLVAYRSGDGIFLYVFLFCTFYGRGGGETQLSWGYPPKVDGSRAANNRRRHRLYTAKGQRRLAHTGSVELPPSARARLFVFVLKLDIRINIFVPFFYFFCFLPSFSDFLLRRTWYSLAPLRCCLLSCYCSDTAQLSLCNCSVRHSRSMLDTGVYATNSVSSILFPVMREDIPARKTGSYCLLLLLLLS